MVNMTLQEQVLIEGEERTGLRFSIPLYVTYNPLTESTEQAIINAYNSRVATFEELVIEQNWGQAYWTYPSGAKQLNIS